MSLGQFKYERLYRCKLEPEEIEQVYLEVTLQEKPDWCPIKPMPERREVCGRYPQQGKPVPSYRFGWNACLDEIEGK